MTSQSHQTADQLARWEIQLRKGILEFIILLSISQSKDSIFEMVANLAETAGIDLPKGTMYPLLLRLSKEGLISAELREGDWGPPRKYYTLTPEGGALLSAMKPRWEQLVTSINSITAGSEN